MELDVHLTREDEEPWGFEFIGGADYGIPLTIDKVLPSSPAQRAGLQPGDVVARLGDRLAADLSQEKARAIIAEAVGSLSFGICRGLYDPVIDDYEPIYDPIDRADSDLRSEPTEVQFPVPYDPNDPNDSTLDDPRLTDLSLTDPSLWDSGYVTGPLSESRSLTASPFVPNAKPYRPFSTEPLEVPPLDDPIILNPGYKDTFGFKDELGNVKALEPGEDDLLRLLPLDRKVEAKFKLPVSEKYDPEWDKKVKGLLEKCTEGGRRESRHVDNELVYYAGNDADISTSIKISEESNENVKVFQEVQTKDVSVESEVTKGTVKFETEQTNMKTVEQMALEVVEESIERAVSVTKEIQAEVEKELRASMTKELQIKENKDVSEVKTHDEEVESNVERKESIIKIKSELEVLNANKLESETEIKVIADEEINEKLIKDQQFLEERMQSTKKEIEEMTEIGNVKRKSSVFVKDMNNSTEIKEGKKESLVLDREDVLTRKEVGRKVSTAEERRSQHVKEFKSSGVFNTEPEGKQKAYMIGLQTIPHIKGFVQSSYHFDLLLRTFFVHLTDVMVALSRFILTQPKTELEGKAEKIIKEKLIKEFASQNIEEFETNEREYKHEDRKQSVQVKQQLENVVQDKQEMKITKTEVKKEMQQEQKGAMLVKQDIKTSEEIKPHKDIVVNNQTFEKHESLNMNLEEQEIRKKSGAEMAQRTQRKSKDLTQKMDAVITEFETKTGIEDRLDVAEQSRRSRSRSHVEEEVMRESDPLEWLDKVDSRSASQERSELTAVKKEFSNFSESKEYRKSETKQESKSTKVKSGKQMYVAIVESHVYTNEDAIIEDQVAEMSETASMQSSEKINAALESSEAMSSENVVLSNIIQSDEKQQAVEVITNALEEAVQEKQEILETVSEFKSQITEQYSKAITQESHASVAAESTDIISDSKIETFEVKELNKSNATAVHEESYKTAAVEFVDVPLEATKEIVIEPKAIEQEAIAKQEVLATVAAQSTEIITDEPKLESFKAEEITSKTAIVSTEETYKTAAFSTTEILLEQTKEETELNLNSHQAVEKVESLAIAVAESTDVFIDDSNLETFENKELVSKKAKVSAEETFKTAAVGITDVTFETAEEKHSESAKTSQATVREGQHLAVAGIIETKTELCKEPKKTAEDEYASLKIVKEQIIDSDTSVEIHSQSDISVKKSLDIEMSNSKQVHSSTSKESYQSITQETSSIQENVQSSTKRNLHINTDLAQVLERQTDETDENNNTPTPTIPTPLTDEYVFKLEIPLPKNQGTVVVEESPDREDPHIVKKGLIPYIESTIEDQIIYDPPLPTPPVSPVYTKPGLRGGAQPLLRKEYIREIERKSSLLASAIDQTIKSIEEYKEEVGIDNEVTIKLPKKKTPKNHEGTTLTNGFTHTNGFANGHEENEFKNGIEMKEWAELKVKVAENNENEQKLSKENENKLKVENGASERDNGEKESDAPPGFKPVVFNPESFQARLYEEVIRGSEPAPARASPYVNESGEPLGTVQGIVDGLEQATVDENDAKDLGKPGLSEDKIAVLISGESEMLREAHVMGLTRVLSSHMTRADGSSVDFQKIKPLVESLKDSEVLKVLNEELMREKEKKKMEEKKWTTFLQKPKRPVPKAKFGYFGNVEQEEVDLEEPYKVKIVKQPKPKVAPDYKPEDFETGLLPWEQRALTEPVPSPSPPEEPILVPEEEPQFLEAVDPLPETEVPDLEDTGIPLLASPPTVQPEAPLPPPEEPLPTPEEPQEPPPEPPEATTEEPPDMRDSETNQMAEQLVNAVKGMVDPSAPLERQLAQMRAQVAALAQLPCVIQQSLELLTTQLSTMSRQESLQSCQTQMKIENHQQVQEHSMESIQEYNEEEPQKNQEGMQNGGIEHTVPTQEVQEVTQRDAAEEAAAKKREEEAMMEEQRRNEKEKKVREENLRLEQESRQLKQRAPRVGKPQPVFGPREPVDRPLVLPGGRRWRGPKDAYNEQMINETLQAQSELLQGKVLGINFMKYEKPPVSLDHLQNSATFKLIHDMEVEPPRRVELRTPVMSEADYRARCGAATPNMQVNGRM